MKTPVALSLPRVAMGAVLGVSLVALGACASTDQDPDVLAIDDVTNRTSLSFHELRTPSDDEVTALQEWYASDAVSGGAVRGGETAIPVEGFVITEVEHVTEGLEPSIVDFEDLTLLAVKPASFTHSDMDPNRCDVTLDDRGMPALRYTMREERRQAYSDWSDTMVGRHTAMVIGDRAVSLPYFVGRIGGSGMLSGSFEDGELREILAAIRGAE